MTSQMINLLSRYRQSDQLGFFVQINQCLADIFIAKIQKLQTYFEFLKIIISSGIRMYFRTNTTFAQNLYCINEDICQISNQPLILFTFMKSATQITTTLAMIIVISIIANNLQVSQDQSLPRLLLAYQTNSIRSTLNTNLCQGLSRNQLTTQQDRALNQDYVSQLKSTIPANGNTLINKVLDNSSNAQSLIMENVSGLGLFIGPFAAAFVIIMIIWPFLACCCCCPGCCPPKCCRQNQGQLYSKCEMRWPVFVLTLALLLTISASVYGFIKAPELGKNITSMACAVSLIPDDLLNGNVTSDGSSYFSGLKMLNQQLGEFSGNLTLITNNLKNLNSTNTTISNIKNDGDSLLNSIKNVDGNSGAGMAVLNYGAPISESSTFPSILGTYSTSGLIYAFYTAVSIIQNNILSMSSQFQSFLNVTGTIVTGISSAQTEINSLINSANNLDSNLQGFNGVTSYNPYIKLVTQVTYAVFIGLSAIALFGMILMSCCGKYKCRYMMYFACFFMLFIALVGFILVAMISTFLPIMNWTCEYLNISMSSDYNFNYNLRGVDSTTRDYISTCMPYGSGDLISKFNIPSLSTFNNLTSAFSFLNGFSSATLNTNLTTAYNDLLNTVDSYGKSIKADISNTGIAVLSAYSQPSTFSCADPNYALDSYIPSISQNPIYVNCAVSGAYVGSAQCSAGNFNARTGGCVGCIDIPQTFKTFINVNDAKNAILARYPTCGASATALQNLWTNYFLQKQKFIGNSYTNDVTSVYSRISSLSISFNTFKTDITNVGTAMTTVNTSLSSVNSLLDPKYGMLGGLNCKVFGEDIQIFIDSLCINTFNSLYITRLAVGIASFGLFFSLFCIVCSGSRHFRQNDCRNSKIQNSSKDQKEYRKGEDTLESIRRK